MTNDTEGLREQIKNMFFRPVHIDHQNVIPDSITITKEGIEYYVDEALTLFTQRLREAERVAVLNELYEAIDVPVVNLPVYLADRIKQLSTTKNEEV